jgi:uncharacterized protein (DUF2141 family)
VRHRSRAISTLILAAPLVAATPPDAGAEISVMVTGLRSAKGQVLACLTTQPRAFPNCAKDPASHKLVVPVSGNTVRINFGPIAPGRYAISLLHDENGNGKADMALFMPKEGFGFSRDAPVRLGPPSFNSAAFIVADVPVNLAVRMRYMF